MMMITHTTKAAAGQHSILAPRQTKGPAIQWRRGGRSPPTRAGPDDSVTLAYGLLGTAGERPAEETPAHMFACAQTHHTLAHPW